MDTIYGALSVYLLIAFVWGVGYMLLEKLHPGSLALGVMHQPNQQIDWTDCMFYSFVTLTSLGYGDIVPLSPQSRSLSILESVSGTMFVAVLIARLVGLYSATRTMTAGAGSSSSNRVEKLPPQTSYPSRTAAPNYPEGHSGTHAD
jgi:hypothetical protein